MTALRWGVGISLVGSVIAILFGIFILAVHASFSAARPAAAGDTWVLAQMVSWFIIGYGVVSGAGLILCLRGSSVGPVLLFLPVLLIFWWISQSPSMLGEMSPVVAKIGLDVVLAIATLSLKR